MDSGDEEEDNQEELEVRIVLQYYIPMYFL